MLRFFSLLRFSVAATTTAGTTAFNEDPADITNNNTTTVKYHHLPEPPTFFTRCDMEIVPLPNDTIALRGSPRFKAATVPHIHRLKKFQARYSSFLLDPWSRRAFAGWVFAKSDEEKVKAFLCQVEQECAEKKLPADFKHFLSGNKLVQAFAVGEHWVALTGTPEFPQGPKLYRNVLRKNFSAAFVDNIHEIKPADVDLGQDFHYGWMVHISHADGLMDWLKSSSLDEVPEFVNVSELSVKPDPYRVKSNYEKFSKKSAKDSSALDKTPAETKSTAKKIDDEDWSLQ